MKKRILFSLLLSTALFGNDKQIIKEFEELPNFKNFNTKVLELKKIDNDWYSIKGLQETRQGKRTFDAFSNKKVIIFGTGYDLETGKNLNIKTDFTKFIENTHYTFGSGKDEYFLITDPECPYCKDLEEKLPLLEKNIKLHVIINPDLIPSHLSSKGMMYYILSHPKDKRAKITKEIMLEKDLSKTLKKIDKFNISLYQSLISLQSNPDAKRVVDMYISEIEKAFALKLDTKDKIDKFLKDKIVELKKNDLSSIELEYKTSKEIQDMYFKPDGTPSVYKISGEKLDNQFELFTLSNTINMKKIKEMSIDKTLSIRAGKIGAPKLYYFIGTQCGACREEFKDDKKLEKMLENYEVYFFLSLNGSNYAKAAKELKYIYSQNDENLKFNLLKALMQGKELSMNELNKSYEIDYDKKIQKYLNVDMRETFIMATPTIIDENGKNLR